MYEILGLRLSSGRNVLFSGDLEHANQELTRLRKIERAARECFKHSHPVMFDNGYLSLTVKPDKYEAFKQALDEQEKDNGGV